MMQVDQRVQNCSLASRLHICFSASATYTGKKQIEALLVDFPVLEDLIRRVYLG
jgi:hypothetical protein